MTKVWTFQDPKQFAKLGNKAPWCVGWYADGKRKQKTIGQKTKAKAYAEKLKGEIAAGLFREKSKATWAAFRARYESEILVHKAVGSQSLYRDSFDAFERHAKPGRVESIATATIDRFISNRAKDPGRKRKSKVSPATINRDLRHIKAALSVAAEWKMLTEVPKFRKVKEFDRIGDVVTIEHFQQIFDSCGCATMPRGLHCEPDDWWRALVAFAITTGWRIDEILQFRREDLDLDSGRILTRAESNKGGRDSIDYLPAESLDLVKKMIGFTDLVFYWPHDRRTLDIEFHRIQAAAGVSIPCRMPYEHECSERCHFYGFHALRRGYATMNVERMSASVLQRKMRHKSFTTTQRYIDLVEKMKDTRELVYVPDVLARAN